MAADSKKTSPEMFISRRPKKNRINRVNGTPNKDHHLIVGNNNNNHTTTPVVINPKTLVMTPRKVPVLYYLTRNGHIEHPHLIDVPLSSPHGLYLTGDQSLFIFIFCIFLLSFYCLTYYDCVRCIASDAIAQYL